ncbi:MAG TPA: D-xylose transporter XylE [Marinilabiliales bacterium]|jgi:SP family xylose:H+ symportor-like MFS transporter|nr:MAG: D-xylose transporter XylE [Bacteroidetes bacterium GWA2_40_14]OFX61907.1 MAG: D-xylose transporter XylE [Bacteroidetes bacterium GWC2_40_13]OFX74054.1 MAG: D-xylose transporter XylE [Bacteroidetes bacterium GWD2_40_43]OFX93111.1 MAG: D-xylose transporter XylE [Bacteroidetes bacterium GWE2_40_63]OFY21481.1 MAG: D-xylose transporter XylE [Bacteroidetes bacterium GWF2_40_13]OFZ24137.1 MAG: D-xylose transporter XylE [Bacteroidetes bacterium RIFOXYC2_FULL_40_12]HAM98125.1 D-xylose transpor
MANKNSSLFYLILLTLTATLGGLLFGYDTAVISGTVESLKKVFIDPNGWPEAVANSQHGFLISSALIGCIIGGLIGGLVSLHLGRKRGLILAAILFLISAIGSAMPEMFVQPIGTADHSFRILFIVYRIIGGIGVGLASMLSPMYIAEISPAHMRGKLVAWNQFAIIFGMLVVYFVNYSISLQGDDSWLHQIGWRWMFASEIIPALLFLGLLFFIPETPRYMLLKNNPKEALRILERLNKTKEEANSIFNEIQQTIVSHSGKLFSFGFLVIIIGIMLSVFQQFVGINVVLYYAPEIFKNMGSNTDTALLQTIIVGAINLSFTVLAIFTVDKLGRKPLQIIGALGMAVSMFVLGMSFFTEKVGWFALISMLSYVAFFALSWGPVVWVLLSELFPNRIRGRAMAVAVAAQWISNLAISWTFPMMNNSTWLTEHFNHGFAYWIYGLMGIFAAWFMWKFVPETKGKTLEEIEHFWKK